MEGELAPSFPIIYHYSESLFSQGKPVKSLLIFGGQFGLCETNSKDIISLNNLTMLFSFFILIMKKVLLKEAAISSLFDISNSNKPTINVLILFFVLENDFLQIQPQHIYVKMFVCFLLISCLWKRS